MVPWCSPQTRDGCALLAGKAGQTDLRGGRLFEWLNDDDPGVSEAAVTLRLGSVREDVQDSCYADRKHKRSAPADGRTPPCDPLALGSGGETTVAPRYHGGCQQSRWPRGPVAHRSVELVARKLCEVRGAWRVIRSAGRTDRLRRTEEAPLPLLTLLGPVGGAATCPDLDTGRVRSRLLENSLRREELSSVEYWNQVRALQRYADYLIGGGDPGGHKAGWMRQQAFPNGNSTMLRAMHTELAARQLSAVQPTGGPRPGQIATIHRLAEKLGESPPDPSSAAEAAIAIGTLQKRAKQRRAGRP